MHFKIKSVRVKISFTFFALILLSICFDNSEILLVSLICSLLHEIVHVVFIILCGGRISEISLSLSGGKIQRHKNVRLSYSKEVIISLCAPVFNIITGAFMLLSEYRIISYVNLVIGFFNLLPFYDFDGGRGLLYILSMYTSYKKSMAILNVTSATSVVLVSLVTVTMIFQEDCSASLIILSGYMIFSLLKNLSSEIVKIN